MTTPQPQPNKPFRGFLRRFEAPRLRARGQVPVNKAGIEGGVRLPQIDNPVLLGAAAVGALGAGLAVSRLRSAGRGGRQGRFAVLLTSAVEGAGFAVGERSLIRDLDVQVLEGFGKAVLISVDVLVDDEVSLWSPIAGEQMLDALTRAAWHNREVAPVAVRGRVMSAVTGEEVLDMSGLGFEGEIARPEELLSRYGAPAFDPTWRG